MMLDCDFIQRTIVNAETDVAIFSDNQQRLRNLLTVRLHHHSTGMHAYHVLAHSHSSACLSVTICVVCLDRGCILCGDSVLNKFGVPYDALAGPVNTCPAQHITWMTKLTRLGPKTPWTHH